MFRQTSKLLDRVFDVLDEMLVGDPEELELDEWPTGTPESDGSCPGDWRGARTRRVGQLSRSVDQSPHDRRAGQAADRRPGQVSAPAMECLTPVAQQRCDGSRDLGR